MHIRLLTYNIFSCRNLQRAYDIEGKIKVITEADCDIVSLNEVHQGTRHSGFTSQTAIIADRAGYPYRYFARAIEHDGGEYGIALLSRYPIVSVRTVPTPETPPREGLKLEPRVHIDAVADVKGIPVRVLVSHYGLSEPEQRRGVADTIRLAAQPYREKNIPVIFMGDLNNIAASEPLRPLFERFTDTGELLGPEGLTYPSYAPERKIDYIFVSRDFKTEECRVIESLSSDHKPLSAVVSLS